MTFQNLRGGERIKVKVYAGYGRNGPQYSQRTVRVNRLLVFPSHCVCDDGRGQPVIVDERNFVEVVKSNERSSVSNRRRHRARQRA